MKRRALGPLEYRYNGSGVIDQTFADFIIDYVQSVVGRKEEDECEGWMG